MKLKTIFNNQSDQNKKKLLLLKVVIILINKKLISKHFIKIYNKLQNSIHLIKQTLGNLYKMKEILK